MPISSRWLSKVLPFGSAVLEGAFQATAPLIFSGEAFDEGYYLVKIQWLEFVSVDSANQRRYRLGEERMLSVHSLLRFSPGRLSR